MEVFLGKVTQHAMNYAIRSGIGITASFAIKQTSRLLRTVDDNGDRRELQMLQERLNSKIKIISPAIDLIDLISARGNTTLESAVSTTKELRWDIQALGKRLEKAAVAEESSRKKSNRANSKTAHEAEIRLIIQDIRSLLTRIDEAVPGITLAIASSGVKPSTTMPPSVSPSRMLQASAFLNACDIQYSITPGIPAQVGPSFVLTLYMLFAGHSSRMHNVQDTVRDTTWKEVIHKARVKLMRVPISLVYGDLPHSNRNLGSKIISSVEGADNARLLRGEERQNEYAYRLEIIEDLDDDRVHSFEEDELQPGPFKDVQLAGIRDILPIHQISRIFYADTGKILNIGAPGEPNNPVLLFKRDLNAQPPRKMMKEDERNEWHDQYQEDDVDDVEAPLEQNTTFDFEGDDSEDEVERQIRRESSIFPPKEDITSIASEEANWRLPADLDPEWLAFEVYTESNDPEDEENHNANDDSAYDSHRPSSSGQEGRSESDLAEGVSVLTIEQSQHASPHPAFTHGSTPSFSPIRTSLSLLEMLIRLTSLQQFEQASHLTAKDETLTFFLEESSTTGGDDEQRKRTRNEARSKVGFDPYNESPIKRHGEEYQMQNQDQDHDSYSRYSRGTTPYEEFGSSAGYPTSSPRWARERSRTPQATPESWLMRSRESTEPQGNTPDLPPVSSPISPYRPQRKNVRPLDRLQQERGVLKGSPLGRGMSVDTDSTLGTSPGSPTLVNREEKV